MEFGAGFWGPIIATGVMLFGVFIGWLILRGSQRITPPRPTKEKITTYACGEESRIEETQASTEQFYSPVRRVFSGFYRYIRPSHSGDLRTYLLWIVSGFVIILIIIVLAWW
ncbi:hypothetical protein AKJ48_04275 [candidate division MSBL1 archaeon SCGC-AAA261O19]|uniref:Hydrogenase n=2 Tax=candidate division MSBL1 TaxID=215777 RepID=A0A133V029_9EURY|nr:hypothetical protein AKJ42_02510 [candidate division MSBL1 archaeon SCGC-AAA261C02]KXB03056.1 hypothetical protein AKJ48_04275 [candidate division MSBL1 archaeon SCGC-AAA261O19]